MGHSLWQQSKAQMPVKYFDKCNTPFHSAPPRHAVNTHACVHTHTQRYLIKCIYTKGTYQKLVFRVSKLGGVSVFTSRSYNYISYLLQMCFMPLVKMFLLYKMS